MDAHLTRSDVLEEIGLVAQDTRSGSVEEGICLRYEHLGRVVLSIAAVSKRGGSNLYPEPLRDHPAPSIVMEEAPDPRKTVREYAGAEK